MHLNFIIFRNTNVFLCITVSILCQKLKFRGWGTETGLQPHIEDHYQKQREDLYEAASNRETLSALSLAFTSPR